MAAAGPTTRRRQLGTELHRLRSRAVLTLEAAGDAVGVSRATINRFESKQGGVKWVIAEKLCGIYGASEAETRAVVQLAKEAKVQGWWKAFSSGTIPEWITPLLTLEDEAVEECHWASTYVPGLLQTRSYAEAVIGAAESRTSAPEAISQMVDVRMKRQDVLTRTPPMHMWVILDEGVLRRVVGSTRVMADQLAHLAQAAQTQYVTIQVLPFTSGAHAAESTGFILLRGQEPALDVVHLSNLSGALYLEKPGELDRHRTVFDYLRSQALSTAESSEMILHLGEQYATAARKETQ
ncbi:helix-turn-helix domain-containing protein [Streptomyces sp. NPDC087850]|uniref:helix-turn-helix domain-containing protein n=1 Tax=Streptomyces sp. NPDC087850 TaxID=3365809 RepID=UPI0038288D94